MGQASYACCLWVGLFALPPLYRTCSPALDALVDEGLGLLVPLLQPGDILIVNRTTLQRTSMPRPAHLKVCRLWPDAMS